MNKSIIDVTPEELIARLKCIPGEAITSSSDLDFDSGIVQLGSLTNISNKWNLPPSHRKFFLKNVANFFLRKIFFAMKIFLNGIVHSQELFNKKILDFLRGVNGKIRELYSFGNEFRKRIDDIEGKNNQIDRLVTQIKEKDNVNIDYFDFENKFRGAENDIIKRQEQYLQYFEGKKNVLDIGSGRGEFLELLYSRGIEAKGIDIDSEFVKYCKKKKFNVDLVDAIEYLTNLEDECLDGISCFQVIEHFENKYLVDLINLCHKKLKKDSFLVFETPNPRSLSVFTRSFYMDLSHKKPIHPATLEFLFNSIGFGFVKLEYVSLLPNDDILRYGNNDDPDYKRNVDMLNSIIYGPQDYALIAKK